MHCSRCGCLLLTLAAEASRLELMNPLHVCSRLTVYRLGISQLSRRKQPLVEVGGNGLHIQR